MHFVNIILPYFVGPVSSVEGLSYNYFDEMAQSYCAASHKFFTFTIRRDCAGVAPTCQDICENAKKEILARTGNSRKHVACYDALFIRKGHPKLRLNPTPTQPDSGLVSMETYGYGSQGCSWEPNHCGPNYCCCKAY